MHPPVPLNRDHSQGAKKIWLDSTLPVGSQALGDNGVSFFRSLQVPSSWLVPSDSFHYLIFIFGEQPSLYWLEMIKIYCNCFSIYK